MYGSESTQEEQLEEPRQSDGSLRRPVTRFSSDSLLLAALGLWHTATERSSQKLPAQFGLVLFPKPNCFAVDNLCVWPQGNVPQFWGSHLVGRKAIHSTFGCSFVGSPPPSSSIKWFKICIYLYINCWEIVLQDILLNSIISVLYLLDI